MLREGHGDGVAAFILDDNTGGGERMGLYPPYLRRIVQRNDLPCDMPVFLAGDGDAVRLDPFRCFRIVRPDGVGAGAPQEYLPFLHTPGSGGAAHPVEGAILYTGLPDGFGQGGCVVHKVRAIMLRVFLHHPAQKGQNISRLFHIAPPGDHSPGTGTFPQIRRGCSPRPRCPGTGRPVRFHAGHPG